MKMTDFLDSDKENIITEIAATGDAGKAIHILENELDKLLLKHNEQCASDRERDAAAYLTQAVRLSLPLIDSVGKTSVWESAGDDSNQGSEKKKLSIPFILLIIAAIGLMAYGLVPLFVTAMSETPAQDRSEMLLKCAIAVAGAIMAFFAGTLSRRTEPARGRKHHVEIKVDAAGIYRKFRAAVFSIDQSLEEIRNTEMWEQREQAGLIEGRPAMTPELELFAGLLEAAYSGDPEYALEKIEAIKYYLHRQQIEVTDYSEETAKYFDLMPGSKAGTIRPALVADGALLKKGLASSGR